MDIYKPLPGSGESGRVALCPHLNSIICKPNSYELYDIRRRPGKDLDLEVFRNHAIGTVQFL